MAPALRGLLAGSLKRDFVVATALGFGSLIAWQVLVKASRKKQYEEFYKTYDPQSDFERLKKAGVFTSVLPDGSTGSGW